MLNNILAFSGINMVSLLDVCDGSDWLASGDIQKLVVVIADQKTKETKERWTFDIQLDKEAAATFVEPFYPKSLALSGRFLTFDMNFRGLKWKREAY
jgi:hypothetical protein